MQQHTAFITKVWEAIAKNDFISAKQLASQAFTMFPETPDAAHALAIVAHRDGRSDLALPLLDKALANGASAEILKDYAEVYLVTGEPDKALEKALQALEQFGESSALLGLMAAIYAAKEDFTQTIQAARKAIALDPETLVWQSTLAYAELINQRFDAGFQSFTFRVDAMVEHGRCPVLQFAEPGELWLKNEQGPGDTLFYLCYAPALLARGWKLHVQTHPAMQKVLQHTGLFASVELAFKCPPTGFWMHIGDLPLAARQLGIAHLQPPLALHPQPKLIEKLSKILQKFGPPPYIAVTWRGGAKGRKLRNGVRMGDRYFDCQSLGTLLSKTNATIISLQRLPDEKESKAFEKALGRKYLNLSRLNDNLSEMLALLSLVDDYIGVPNTNHHLREALGKPSRMLVNRPYEDWRWVTEDNSPWYPQAKCYRQTIDGDLSQVLIEIEKDLFKAGLISSSTDIVPLSEAETEADVSQQIAQWIDEGWAALHQHNMPGAIPVAIQKAQQVLSIAPKHPGALHLLGWAAVSDFKFDLALGLLQQACQIAPDRGVYMRDFIRALTLAGREEQALMVADAALNDPQLRGKSAIHYAQAGIYFKLGRELEALKHYDACLKISPNNLEAMTFGGMVRMKLGSGHARLGFKQYSARKECQREEFNGLYCCPVLRDNIEGQHILIVRDMGIGDELSYLRYLPWLVATGAKVTYWCGAKLLPLLQRLSLDVVWIPDNQPRPDPKNFDLAFVVTELPYAVEYYEAPEIAPPLALNPDPDLVKKWQTWLKQQGAGPYIGFNWRAGVATAEKSQAFSRLAKAIDPNTFAQTLSGINATWISLQRNVTKSELNAFEHTLQAPVFDAASISDSADDMLALLSVLDANVGVSNTNMHLRAGLGMSSHVLVQNPGGDWRWGIEGAASEWFKSSKVYRQSNTSDWRSALQQLRVDLIESFGEIAQAAPLVQKETQMPKMATQKIIWVTAADIVLDDNRSFTDVDGNNASIVTVAKGLEPLGWHSTLVNEQLAELMGGWNGQVPQSGDCVVFSKVISNHAHILIEDAVARGAFVVVHVSNDESKKSKRLALFSELAPKAHAVIASPDTQPYLSNCNIKIDNIVESVTNDMTDTDKQSVVQSWVSTLNMLANQPHTERKIASTIVSAQKRVLIGMLYSGESEFEQAKQALTHQSHTGFEFFEICNLPNKQAHDQLYETFMSKAATCEYFLKLDADMVMAHEQVLAEMVETMVSENLAHLFAYVKDCPGGLMIPGIQMFRSDTRWLGSQEQLNVDYPPSINGASKQFFDKNWILHMPNPDDYQLFRYGVHKALKSLQPDRTNKDLKKGILHLSILNGMARRYLQQPELIWALMGAVLVYQKTFDSIEYNSDLTRQYFEILKNKPHKLEPIKKQAEQFWGCEIQVNYWWLDHFASFGFAEMA